jgi:hypothetical protein
MKCFIILMALLISLLISSFLSAAELKPYIVFLKPGTELTRLSDKKNLAIEKGMYARVLETNYKKRDLFYVYDEKGNALYETMAKFIVEVEDDYALLPKQRADVVYPAPSQLKIADKTRTLQSQFNVHMDNLQTSDFNSIYSDSLASVTAPRFELRTMYERPDLPFGIGGSINYQSTSWKNDVDQIRFSVLSFGPVFLYDFFEDDDVRVTALLGAEFAPVYRTSSGDSKEEYKAMLYDVGVEGAWKTDYGFWAIGSHYRMHTISLESSNRTGVNPEQGSLSIKSLGIMVGYKHDWSL